MARRVSLLWKPTWARYLTPPWLSYVSLNKSISRSRFRDRHFLPRVQFDMLVL